VVDRLVQPVQNVYQTIKIKAVEVFKRAINTTFAGSIVDNVLINDQDIILLTGQTAPFSPVENGLWRVNTNPTPPTRLVVGGLASSKIVNVEDGQQYAGSVWMCKTQTLSDVNGTNELQYERIDSNLKLYAGMYQNIVTYSVTLSGVANTWELFNGFDAGSPSSGSMLVNTAVDEISTPVGVTRTYEIEYNIAWNSTTGGGKTYEFQIWHSIDGGPEIPCRASLTQRGLSNNDVGQSSGSCMHICYAGTVCTFMLKVRCNVPSVNLTTYSAHMRVKQID
jgi:hypothetical protein